MTTPAPQRVYIVQAGPFNDAGRIEGVFDSYWSANLAVYALVKDDGGLDPDNPPGGWYWYTRSSWYQISSYPLQTQGK